MVEYIKKEDALSFPFANGQYDHKNADEHFILGCETYKEWIEQIPAADVQTVVYCRDCYWWKKQEASIQGRCSLLSMYPTGNWYCANGQKRTKK